MSTVPAVLAALATLGTATLTSSQVINGPAGSVTTTGQRLFLVGDEDFEVDNQFDSVGGVTTTEHYAVPCAIAADLPTPEQTLADAAAWADFEALQAALAADPSLGLSGTYSLRVAILNLSTVRRLPRSSGRHTLIRLHIDVFAAQS